MGLDGKPFTIYKFRSMRRERRACRPVRSGRAPEDPRRTDVGQVLAASSASTSCPQLYERATRATCRSSGRGRSDRTSSSDFKERIPKYMLRHKVKAGHDGLGSDQRLARQHVDRKAHRARLSTTSRTGRLSLDHPHPVAHVASRPPQARILTSANARHRRSRIHRLASRGSISSIGGPRGDRDGQLHHRRSRRTSITSRESPRSQLRRARRHRGDPGRRAARLHPPLRELAGEPDRLSRAPHPNAQGGLARHAQDPRASPRQRSATYLLASTSEVYGDPLVHPQKRGLLGQREPHRTRAASTTRRSVSPRRWASPIGATTGSTSKSCASSTPTGRGCGFGTAARSPRSSASRLDRRKPMTVFGAGDQTRSFCFVSDLVVGHLQAACSRRTTARSTSVTPRR